MKVLDFNYISKLGVPPEIITDWCNDVWKIKEECVLPAKMKMWEGDAGRYITMPCVIPQYDICGVKFIARNVDDVNGIPARNSNILLQSRSQMGLLAITDGIWITNMRTGAIAAHSVMAYSKKNFQTLGIMGLGLVARAFMFIFGSLYKKPIVIRLLRYKNQAESFVERFSKDFPQFSFEIVDTYEDVCSCDTVVSAVSFAHSTFVDESIFKPGCLLVPIHTAGFQNCDLTFDRFIIDDYEHVKSYKYYEQFKFKTVEMGKIARGEEKGRRNDKERIVSYCGGIALHDIYFAYRVYKIAEDRGDAPQVEMHFPNTHLWI